MRESYWRGNVLVSVPLEGEEEKKLAQIGGRSAQRGGPLPAAMMPRPPSFRITTRRVGLCGRRCVPLDTPSSHQRTAADGQGE